MGRAVILGNGSLTVGLNEQGLVHDFYFPYVGLDNLTTARSVHHKIGISVDGVFKWVNKEEWHIVVDFEENSLTSKVRMECPSLGVSLDFNDFVDSSINLFGRLINVSNLTDEKKDIKLFLHQVFEISRAGRADTALFVPEYNYVLDYKGRCCLLIYGQDESGGHFDQFSIGSYGIEGKEGTFKDAEDGELSNNPVEHGGVDSTIRFNMQLDGHKTSKVDYWIIASESQYHLEKLHQSVLADSLSERLNFTRNWWRDWLHTANPGLANLDDQYKHQAKKSLLLIKSHCDKHGGVLASCDSSIYNYGRDYYSYVWPRDGAFVLWPLIRLGFTDEPKKFFKFCQDIMHKDGYMMHKYQPDRAIGSTWHPLVHNKHKELAIQEDETAIVVFMLGEYYDYSHDREFISEMFDSFIEPAANFMTHFVDEQTGLPHASYDLWEEKFLTTHYTTATVVAALRVAIKLANVLGRESKKIDSWKETIDKFLRNSNAFYDSERNILRKGFYLEEDKSIKVDGTLDVSTLFGAFAFQYAGNKDQIKSTAKVIEEELLDHSPAGGSPRYEFDRYFMSQPPYKGNPWFVTSFWIAQYYIRTSRPDKAKKILDWSLLHCLSSGAFPEQIHPQDAKAVGVAPLVWSHAEFLSTVLDLAEKPE